MTHGLKLAVAAAAFFALAACSDSGSDSNSGGGATPSTRLEDNFGASFGTAFRADANGDPIDPTPTTINATDPAAEPVAVP